MASNKRVRIADLLVNIPSARSIYANAGQESVALVESELQGEVSFLRSVQDMVFVDGKEVRIFTPP